MKIWNRIKHWLRDYNETNEKDDVLKFLVESPLKYKPMGPEVWPFGLPHIEDRQEDKEDLTATYTYQEGDDLLAKKQDFIDQYTQHEKQQLNYFTVEEPKSKNRSASFARCKAWRDHEQEERFQGQKAWRQVVRSNHHEHMHQKFMNQKTR